MNIFQRAWAQLPLTPGERAFLKFFEGVLLTALSAGLVAGATYIGSNGTTINLRAAGAVAGGVFAKTLWDALNKWQSAKGDGSLSPAPAPAPAPLPAPAPTPAA